MIGLRFDSLSGGPIQSYFDVAAGLNPVLYNKTIKTRQDKKLPHKKKQETTINLVKIMQLQATASTVVTIFQIKFIYIKNINNH